MTDQSYNAIHHDGNGYLVLAAEPGLFSPWDYGIEPESVESSNWSGYEALFSVEAERLYLHSLDVGRLHRKPSQRRPDDDDPLAVLAFGEPEPLPPLNGVAAENANSSYWRYDNVGLALDYSGTLVVGNDPSAYELDEPCETRELTFVNGKLISTRIHVDTSVAPTNNDLPPPQPVADIEIADVEVAEEVLAQIVGDCRPKALLCCGHSAESVARLWHGSHPDTQLVTLDKASPNDGFPLTLTPDLALVSDTLEQLSSKQGALLLGQLRNYGSRQIAVLVCDNAGWQLTDFTSLGFRRHARLTTANGPCTLYSYNLDSYNHKRSWNNPDHWANPEMWGKAWW